MLCRKDFGSIRAGYHAVHAETRGKDDSGHEVLSPTEIEYSSHHKYVPLLTTRRVVADERLGTSSYASLRKNGAPCKFSKKLPSLGTMGVRLRNVTEAAHARTHARLEFRRDDTRKHAAMAGTDRSALR